MASRTLPLLAACFAFTVGADTLVGQTSTVALSRRATRVPVMVVLVDQLP